MSYRIKTRSGTWSAPIANIEDAKRELDRKYPNGAELQDQNGSVLARKTGGLHPNLGKEPNWVHPSVFGRRGAK